MAKKNTFEKFRSVVHEGVPLEPSGPKVLIAPTETVEIIAEPDTESQSDYQSAFFTRVDFTYRNRFTLRRPPIGD